MNSIGQLDELIATITAQRDILKGRIDELGTPNPTFEDGIHPALVTDPTATAARMILANAATDAAALVQDPQSILFSPIHDHWVALHAINEFGLASTIDPESNEGKTFEEIAKLASHPIDADTVKRVIRLAMTFHIFREEPLGTVRHNATSRYIARTPGIQSFFRMALDYMWPAATQVVNALKKWPQSQEPKESDPQKAIDFAGAMTWFASGPGMEVSHMVNGYPWADLAPGSQVVDVGGSHGECAFAVTAKFPDLHYTVQDLPQVVHEATQKQKSTQTSVGVVSFTPHDFFKPQPIRAASVYFFRMILHDWSDKYAARILAPIAAAMDSNSRLVIMEHIVPEPGRAPRSAEYIIRGFDIAMLEFQNGREREVGDWEALFEKVDPRLRITRTFHPVGSIMGIIEAKLVG